MRINTISTEFLAKIDLLPFIERRDTLQPNLPQAHSDGDGVNSDVDNYEDDDEESDIDDDDEMAEVGKDVEALGDILKAGKCRVIL